MVSLSRLNDIVAKHARWLWENKVRLTGNPLIVDFGYSARGEVPLFEVWGKHWT